MDSFGAPRPGAPSPPAPSPTAPSRTRPRRPAHGAGLAGALDYPLPPGRIAQHPAPRRDEARLLVLPSPPATLRHAAVRDLPDLLAPGDLLVVNDARVLPWKVAGRTARGRTVEVYLMRTLDGAGCFEGYLKTRRPAPGGEDLVLEAGRLRARARRLDDGPRWEIRFVEGAATMAILDEIGRAPLPPYIHRPAEDDPHREEDRERYQTLYAREACAVAAPTAGLHLTPALLERLRARGIQTASVTLAVGPGTFLPLPKGPLENWAPEPETYTVGPEAAAAVSATRARGGRVVAVGTTTCRALETAARLSPGWHRAGGSHGRKAPSSAKPLAPAAGTTDLFLRPGDPFAVVDVLLTNFHMPRTSLLALVAAFAGTRRVLDAYEEALREGYRFFSYGDAMLCRQCGDPS